MLHNKCKGIIKTMLLKGVTTMTERRTLRVTGKGNIKVKPNMTCITIILEGVYSKYDDTLRISTVYKDQLVDLLSPFDIKENDLKSLSFDIDTEYESYMENGAFKQRFAGYSFRHVLKVEFDSDKSKLGKILSALANSPLDPDFRISYTVKDKEKAKNELLGKAVEDAKEKAKLLAKALDVCLKDIILIDYSLSEIDFTVKSRIDPMYYDCAASSDSYEMDIAPDDIDINDTVTIVWEIA